MVKPKGVADCMSYEDLSKSEAAEIERALRSSTLTSEVSLASWKRLLQLALGRNLACGEPPPFALVQIVEALGLDSARARSRDARRDHRFGAGRSPRRRSS